MRFEFVLADDDVFLGIENDKRIVEEWIMDNYQINGDLTISDDFVVDCNGNVKVKNTSITSLTNGLFRWGKINRMFSCSFCENLTSLKGAPEKIDGSFDCSYCNSLTSLVGAPKEVSKNFYCSDCKKLISLEGAPEKTGSGFFCSQCDSLTSLKGAPKEVGTRFSCSLCENLTSLEGSPMVVECDFICTDCENLISLKGAPEKIGNVLYYSNSQKLKITDSDRERYKLQEV